MENVREMAEWSCQKDKIFVLGVGENGVGVGVIHVDKLAWEKGKTEINRNVFEFSHKINNHPNRSPFLLPPPLHAHPMFKFVLQSV